MPSPILLPLSNLSLFALLRNLRLLAGQRPAPANGGVSAPLRVWVGGVGARAVGSSLRKLAGEPLLEVMTDESGALAAPLAALAGERLAAVVISQVFHALPAAPAPASTWAAARAALDPDDGALGLTWYRAVMPPSLAVTAHAAEASLPKSGWRPLAVGEHPITWVESLDIPRAGFKPVKHRKFLERVHPADASERAALLVNTSDDRIGAGAGSAGQLVFDSHLFHTTVRHS